MDSEAKMINTENQKYLLNQGRMRTNKKINGKQWYKSQLAYALYHKLSLEKMKSLSAKGYIVHHKDENIINDRPDNLELLTRSKHMSLHVKGNKYRQGDHHSIETKQKMSNAHKGDKNFRWIPDFPLKKAQQLRATGWTYDKIGQELNYSLSVVWDRLKNT